MKRRAHVAIIGAGVVGLATAYNLAKAGVRDVVVVEQSYVLSGASGRNGGGVRAQWTTTENIELARRSIAMFRKLPQELGINIWFRQGGYLFLAYTDEHLRSLRGAVSFQNAHGIPSKLLDPKAALDQAPDLSPTGIVGASFCPTDGILFPWPVVIGYLERCRELGVDVEPWTSVTAIERNSERVTKVVTNRGEIEADWVVNCAGGKSRDVARLAGVSLPNTPMRHEILSTEPLKPFLDPMVVDMRTGLYASQMMRGEIVGGIGNPQEKAGHNETSSLDFLENIARGLVRLMPLLRRVKIVRQWAGVYDISPDSVPILGPATYPNFIQANGFSGHGFMISPMVAKLVSEYVLTQRPSMNIDPFNVDRFAKGTTRAESFVIG